MADRDPIPPSTTPDSLPRPDFHFTGQVGRTYADSDPAQFPQPVQPPAGAPNIVLILADDVGWGDIRSFNPEGRVALPAIEKLASEGVRFTDAHSSASKCAPSRYSLITGNYQWRGRSGWGTARDTNTRTMLLTESQRRIIWELSANTIVLSIGALRRNWPSD